MAPTWAVPGWLYLWSHNLETIISNKYLKDPTNFLAFSFCICKPNTKKLDLNNFNQGSWIFLERYCTLEHFLVDKFDEILWKSPLAVKHFDRFPD